MRVRQEATDGWPIGAVLRAVALGAVLSVAWSAPAWAGDDDAPGGSLYRSQGADGAPVFSDRPPADGSEVLERRAPPAPVNVMPARPRAGSPSVRPAPAERAPTQEQQGYTLLEITSPEHEATIRHPVEPVPVAYRIEPALQPGHRVLLLVNGVAQEEMALDWPDRGQYVLRVQVVGAEGQELKRSASVTVFVHRPSVLLRPGAGAGKSGKD